MLDVGCGDGELVAQLREHGFDATGIDVREPSTPHCIQVAIEDHVAPAPFDAVVARLSLHHVPHLGVAFERMHEALAPGGAFAMQEFDWTAWSERTFAWVRSVADRPGPEPRTVDFWDGTVDDVRRRWLWRYGELHAKDALLFAADAVFARHEIAAVPYVSWLIDRPDLVEAEAAALQSGDVDPLGFLYVGEPR